MTLCKMELSKLRSCSTCVGTFIPVLHLCNHLMSDTHYNPNATVNSLITGMEMSILIQPKVAAEKIDIWLPDQWQTKIAWHHSKSSHRDLSTDQSENVVLGQRNTTIVCRHFSSPPLLADIF